MTTAVLCQSVSAIQAAPSGGQLPTGSQSVNPAGVSSPINTIAQSFQLVVTSTAGNCSASAQIMVSNDGVNWSAYGAAIVASSAASPNTATGNGTVPWQFFTAYITAISGTGAKATVTMGS